MTLLADQIHPARQGRLLDSMSMVMVIPSKKDRRWKRNREAMMRESEILQRLQHPNIIGLVLPFQEMETRNRGDKTIFECMILDAVKPLGFDLVALSQMYTTSKEAVPSR